MEELKKELLDQYGYNAPFFSKDFLIGKKYNVGDFDKLVKDGSIAEYKDSHYIPDDNFSMNDYINKYIYLKYISDGVQVYGYRTGNHLKGVIGIPQEQGDSNIIASNKVDEKTMVDVGLETYEIIPSYFKVDAMNSKIVQFLDFFNYLEVEEAQVYKDKILYYIYVNDFSSAQRNSYFSICSSKAIGLLTNLGFYYSFIEYNI